MRLVILLIVFITFIIFTTSRLKWHPFLSLLLSALGYGILCGTMTLEEVVKSINSGFGNTVGLIGIVIVSGSIIGTFLEKSGGAHTLAAGTLKIVGQKNVPAALSIIGYLISIPVFCDSGFIIMSPLSKALSRQAGISIAAGAVALSLGLIITHSIIPPTPGPVGAAGILNADLGLVIMLGLPVTIISLISGWLFAIKVASKIHLNDHYKEAPEMETIKKPSLTLSILPIIIPIILIILRSVSLLPAAPFGNGGISATINFMGQPAVALLTGVLFSLFLPKKFSFDMISTSGWVGEAVLAAATIIIITGCGGAFGQVLQNSGIANFLNEHLSDARGFSIMLPVIIAACLKTAQGSGTVAIITGASLMAPLLGPLGLDSPAAKALVVVALGSGGMIASHANDSYFWVVTQLTGMNVNQGYRLQTLGTMTVGIFASFAVWLLSLVIL